MEVSALRIALIAALSALLTGCGNGFATAPTTAEDCILQNMRGIQDSEAAKAVTRACRAKFSRATAPVMDLDSVAVALLDGKGRVENGRFYGQVYNSNNAITVTELLVQIMPEREDSSRVREYRVEVEIPPASVAPISFTILADHGETYSWMIVSARGVKNT